MAKRHNRRAPIYEYIPLHVTSTGTVVPVGKLVGTTATTSVAAPGSVAITPASMANITIGMILNISHGTGTAEDVVVSAITSTTFTATFANTHSGTYNICSYKGTFLKGITVNKTGTSDIFTLYNGNPNAYYAGTTTAVGTPFALFNVAAVGHVEFPGVLDNGLFYTLAGTAGDYTFWYADEY